MKVEQLMTRTVATCSPNDSLADAARIMWEQDCGCVPVVAWTDDGRRRLVGMITDRDVCMAAWFRGAPLAAVPVASAMAHDVATCGPRDTIDVALNVLRTRQIRRLPVVDVHEELVGIFSLADVAREAAAGTNQVRLAQVGETLAAIDLPRPAERAVVAAG